MNPAASRKLEMSIGYSQSSHVDTVEGLSVMCQCRPCGEHMRCVVGGLHGTVDKVDLVFVLM